MKSFCLLIELRLSDLPGALLKCNLIEFAVAFRRAQLQQPAPNDLFQINYSFSCAFSSIFLAHFLKHQFTRHFLGAEEMR